MTAINDFLLSLASAIAAAASLSLLVDPADADARASIWIHDAVESLSTPVYTVLRIYGGQDQGNFADARRLSVHVQADTRGADSPAVLAQAWTVHESMLDELDRPWMMKSIAGKTFSAGGAVIDDAAGSWIIYAIRRNGAPGIVGRPDDRAMATENFDVDFGRVAAA